MISCVVIIIIVLIPVILLMSGAFNGSNGYQAGNFSSNGGYPDPPNHTFSVLNPPTDIENAPSCNILIDLCLEKINLLRYKTNMPYTENELRNEATKLFFNYTTGNISLCGNSTFNGETIRKLLLMDHGEYVTWDTLDEMQLIIPDTNIFIRTQTDHTLERLFGKILYEPESSDKLCLTSIGAMERKKAFKHIPNGLAKDAWGGIRTLQFLPTSTSFKLNHKDTALLVNSSDKPSEGWTLHRPANRSINGIFNTSNYMKKDILGPDDSKRATLEETFVVLLGNAMADYTMILEILEAVKGNRSGPYVFLTGDAMAYYTAVVLGVKALFVTNENNLFQLKKDVDLKEIVSHIQSPYIKTREEQQCTPATNIWPSRREMRGPAAAEERPWSDRREMRGPAAAAARPPWSHHDPRGPAAAEERPWSDRREMREAPPPAAVVDVESIPMNEEPYKEPDGTMYSSQGRYLTNRAARRMLLRTSALPPMGYTTVPPQ
jgi:hypothetical protein